MSIFDGWKLWAGKALFDLTVLAAIIAACVLAFFVWFACLWIRDKYRAIRGSKGKGSVGER